MATIVMATIVMAIIVMAIVVMAIVVMARYELGTSLLWWVDMLNSWLRCVRSTS